MRPRSFMNATRDIDMTDYFTRLSVTLMYCVKTVKHINDISSLSDSLITLVFFNPISLQNSDRVISNRASMQEGYRNYAISDQ